VHQQTVLEVADHALAVAKARAAAGSVDITGVHEAMRVLAAARADALQYRHDLLLSDINLIRALGGGWSASPPSSTHPNTSGSP
jgi:outer membrane protein TolC